MVRVDSGSSDQYCTRRQLSAATIDDVRSAAENALGDTMLDARKLETMKDRIYNFLDTGSAQVSVKVSGRRFESQLKALSDLIDDMGSDDLKFEMISGVREYFSKHDRFEATMNEVMLTHFESPAYQNRLSNGLRATESLYQMVRDQSGPVGYTNAVSFGRTMQHAYDRLPQELSISDSEKEDISRALDRREQLMEMRGKDDQSGIEAVIHAFVSDVESMQEGESRLWKGCYFAKEGESSHAYEVRFHKKDGDMWMVVHDYGTRNYMDQRGGLVTPGVHKLKPLEGNSREYFQFFTRVMAESAVKRDTDKQRFKYAFDNLVQSNQDVPDSLSVLTQDVMLESPMDGPFCVSYSDRSGMKSLYRLKFEEMFSDYSREQRDSIFKLGFALVEHMRDVSVLMDADKDKVGSQVTSHLMSRARQYAKRMEDALKDLEDAHQSDALYRFRQEAEAIIEEPVASVLQVMNEPKTRGVRSEPKGVDTSFAWQFLHRTDNGTNV